MNRYVLLVCTLNVQSQWENHHNDDVLCAEVVLCYGAVVWRAVVKSLCRFLLSLSVSFSLCRSHRVRLNVWDVWRISLHFGYNLLVSRLQHHLIHSNATVEFVKILSIRFIWFCYFLLCLLRGMFKSCVAKNTAYYDTKCWCRQLFTLKPRNLTAFLWLREYFNASIKCMLISRY